MDEQWLPVVGFEGFYEVSNTGLVRNVARGRGRIPGKILKRRPHPDGYAKVLLSGDDKAGKEKLVHRLVLEAFKGSAPQHQPFADHINRNRGDDRAENLRWSTHRENVANRTSPSNTGVLGTHQLPNGRFIAQSKQGRRAKHLGYYETLEKAALARKAFDAGADLI